MPSLEVIAGLLLIILFYSLLATVLMEVIAGALHARGRFLEGILRRMLGDTTSVNGQEKTLYDLFKTNPIYEHISGNAFGKKSPPSYIESDTFRTILLQMLDTFKQDPSDRDLRGMLDRLPSGRIRKILLGFFDEADQHYPSDQLNERFIHFTMRVETWYDDVMDRATGWYKRRTQIILFFVGLAIAGFNNVDVIGVFRSLSKASQADLEEIAQLASVVVDRESIYVGADTTSGRIAPTLNPRDSIVSTEVLEIIREKVETADNPFGIGWNQYVDEDGVFSPPVDPVFWGLKILGIIVMAICISKGAGFWFDILKKIVAFRNTGVVPQRPAPSLPPAPIPTEAQKKGAERNAQ